MAALPPPPGFGAPLQQSPQQTQADKIKRQRDRRVSWAAAENLCQVRLFIAEDAPAMSGSAQELLQAKQTRNLHIFNSTAPLPAPDAPPGFGGVAVKPIPDHIALSAIVPQISWRTPNTVFLDPTWHVMAGGASLEIGVQKQREVRILEAVYPRPSSIPESPAEPVETQEPYDDSITPQIPLVPLEEEDVPEGSDMSNLLSGPLPLSHGSSGQVVGVQKTSPNASGPSNGRPEMMKQYNGDNNPGPMQENSQASKDSTWRETSAVFTARSSLMNHSSDPMSRRPPPAGTLPDVHTHPKQNGVEPDVAAAAAAAFAALTKSQEAGSMIDNELLIQILSDPGLIHRLTSKPPFALPHSKSDLSTNLNGAARGPDKLMQVRTVNGVTVGGNPWMSPPSTSKFPVPPSGQEGSRSRSGETYTNGGERFQGVAGSGERSSTLLLGSVGNGQLYTDVSSGRVGPVTLPRLPSRGEVPPGFGNGKSNGNLPPGFGSKSVPQLGPQTAIIPQVGSTLARPLSRLDEQYYKSLIMQHGCKSADDDDHGRAGIDTKGNGGARPSSSHSAPDVKRWYGRVELDEAGPERNSRERRDNERNGLGLPLDNVTRAKSRKVCIYFGTQRGCRNGDNCTFVHELSEPEKTRAEKVRSAPTHLQYAKRLKVDG